MRQEGWAELFWAAFKQSRNPMLLLDDLPLVVDANDAFLALTGDKRHAVIGQPASSLVVGGPVLSSEEWGTRLAVGHFTGDTELRRVGGDSVVVQWGAHVEIVTGRRLILLVALSMSRWGRHLRPSTPPGASHGELSERERQVVRLVARGRAGPEIADELHISPRHRAHPRAQCDDEDGGALARPARRQGARGRRRPVAPPHAAAGAAALRPRRYPSTSRRSRRSKADVATTVTAT